MEAVTIGGMLRAGMLFFEMHECTGDLNQALVEMLVPIRAFQPEMFEDIVGLVVVAGIEALEIACIARVEAALACGAECFDKCGNPVVLAHG
jgi:hypothetical protein